MVRAELRRAEYRIAFAFYRSSFARRGTKASRSLRIAFVLPPLLPYNTKGPEPFVFFSLFHTNKMSSDSEQQTKKRKRSSSKEEVDSSSLAPIATPLADKKLTKRLLKLVKKSMFLIY